MSEGIIDFARRQIGLWNASGDLKRIESAQPTDSYTHADPSAVGPMPDGLSNVADQTQVQRKQFLGKTYDQLSDDQIEQQRNSARVATMRQNGLYDMAAQHQALGLEHAQAQDRSKLNAAQIDRMKVQTQAEQLGLEDAQQKSQFAKAGQEISARAAKALSGLQDADGNARDPGEEDLIGANMKRSLMFAQAGRFEDAAKARDEADKLISARVASQQGQRNHDGVGALAGIEKGDYGAAMKFYKSYIPDGQEITDIRKGSKDGMLSVTTLYNGKPITAERPEREVREEARRVIAAVTSKDPTAALKLISDQVHDVAKMNLLAAQAEAAQANATQSRASAGASRASAEQTQAETKIKLGDYGQKQAYAKAMSTPEGQQTDEQKSLIRAYQALTPGEKATFTGHPVKIGDGFEQRTGIAVVNNRTGNVIVTDASKSTGQAGGQPATKPPGTRPPLSSFGR